MLRDLFARPSVYRTAIENGGRKEWEFLLGQCLRSGVMSERSNMLRALGASEDVDIIERFLQIMDDVKFSQKDMITVYEAVGKVTIRY